MWRLKRIDPTVAADTNLDDGDRNFHRGLVSNDSICCPRWTQPTRTSVVGYKGTRKSLPQIAQELKEFSFQNVRLLISAGKVDKRKVFYKALDKLGKVENFAGLSVTQLIATLSSLTTVAVTELAPSAEPSVHFVDATPF